MLNHAKICKSLRAAWQVVYLVYLVYLVHTVVVAVVAQPFRRHVNVQLVPLILCDGKMQV